MAKCKSDCFSFYWFLGQNLSTLSADTLRARLQRVARLADRFIQVIIKRRRQNFPEISLFFHFALASLYTSHLVAFLLHKQRRQLEAQVRLRAEAGKQQQHDTCKQRNSDQHAISPYAAIIK